MLCLQLLFVSAKSGNQIKLQLIENSKNAFGLSWFRCWRWKEGERKNIEKQAMEHESNAASVRNNVVGFFAAIMSSWLEFNLF